MTTTPAPPKPPPLSWKIERSIREAAGTVPGGEQYATECSRQLIAPAALCTKVQRSTVSPVRARIAPPPAYPELSANTQSSNVPVACIRMTAPPQPPSKPAAILFSNRDRRTTTLAPFQTQMAPPLPSKDPPPFKSAKLRRKMHSSTSTSECRSTNSAPP